MKERNSTTQKQMLVAQAVVEGKLQTTAKNLLLASAGYSPAIANKNPADVFTSVGFKKALIALGITPEVIAQPAIEALEATKGSFYQGEYYETEKPDHLVRLKGAEQLAELVGAKKVINENHNINVNVDFEDIAGLING